MSQDGEVDIKEREVYDEWNNNQTNGPSRKMLPKMFLENLICTRIRED